MIKKLDKLILRAFVGPFLATFLIAIFVLILQFFWLWIDDFVGKGLDMLTLAEVIMYVAASWVPVALPLAMLLSTIMTFGNLGERFELVAIKSAGISLRRFMRPILIVALVVVGISFLFNNNVLPFVNLKLNKLKYEIVYSKPAFDIKPGVFYNSIEGFVIKLGSRNESGSQIKDIIIYERNNYLQDNLILADSGTMSVSDDKRFLKFLLKDGTRYEERGTRSTTNTELIRLGFQEYEKTFDLSSFMKVETTDSIFRDGYRMLNAAQLNQFRDSVMHIRDSVGRQLGTQFANQFSFYTAYRKEKLTFPEIDTPATSMQQLIPDSALSQSIEGAYSKVTGFKSTNAMVTSQFDGYSKSAREYLLGIHQKFAFAFACFVMFLIGAPLGSIIRRGGIGSPLVLAVIFFAIYHLLNTLGTKLAQEGVVPVAFGIWLPIIVLTPVGIFLVVKAMNDSQLFNKEFYFRFWKQLRRKFGKYRNNRENYSI